MGMLIHYLGELYLTGEKMKNIVINKKTDFNLMADYLEHLEKRYALLLKWREVDRGKASKECTG
ncbi:hypothetical protein H1S01_18285 [Heliobacterium chlorum]|uniref:Uncharacterized protein n=1 Tax=Heliobacterium chlorum TaxID=2698 RepID=A0ABR7T6M9_HELCL|nr:hypothetical protein [Heliobacterium chlorum]MBC9786407.1 hypothetical protein [Heliobacterium chlorum]